jgi:hypothetical protein
VSPDAVGRGGSCPRQVDSPVQHDQADRDAVLAEVAVLPVRAVAPPGETLAGVHGEGDLVAFRAVHGGGDAIGGDLQAGDGVEIVPGPREGGLPGPVTQVLHRERHGSIQAERLPGDGASRIVCR